MKASIHPNWYPEAKVTCACGNSFTVGATFPEIKVDVCYNCHPFYTGNLKLIDTGGRVQAFKLKQQSVSTKSISKTEKRKLKRQKRIEEELSRPESLSELRSDK
ncbi:50S ribosomal protein L31 [Candidatus Woesebacteria bacterium]|nr:50S ribosomal protein L31 [Candidatus Woesebacteria bacterium]